MAKVVELEKALAVLIGSTHRRKRSLSLPEVAKWILSAKALLGSFKLLSDRIGVSEKMLRQFPTVLGLEREVIQLFSKRKIDSVDAAVHLGMLGSQDQKVIANELALKRISTTDLRAFVGLRKSGNQDNANNLINLIMESKNQRRYVYEFIIRGAMTKSELSESLSLAIPELVGASFKVSGSFGSISVGANAKKAIARYAKAHGQSLKDVIPFILRSRVKK